jgi:hypothetical protein
MSATDIPNKNFDNEKQTHTPYSEIVKGNLKSSYEKFRSIKNINAPAKKRKKQVNPEDLPRVDPTAYRKWFNNK